MRDLINQSVHATRDSIPRIRRHSEIVELVVNLTAQSVRVSVRFAVSTVRTYIRHQNDHRVVEICTVTDRLLLDLISHSRIYM
jgi:hypothetical protein